MCVCVCVCCLEKLASGFMVILFSVLFQRNSGNSMVFEITISISWKHDLFGQCQLEAVFFLLIWIPFMRTNPSNPLSRLFEGWTIQGQMTDACKPYALYQNRPRHANHMRYIRTYLAMQTIQVISEPTSPCRPYALYQNLPRHADHMGCIRTYLASQTRFTHTDRAPPSECWGSYGCEMHVSPKHMLPT